MERIGVRMGLYQSHNTNANHSYLVYSGIFRINHLGVFRPPPMGQRPRKFSPLRAKVRPSSSPAARMKPGRRWPWNSAAQHSLPDRVP